ncbi:MAG: CoA-binding protein [Bryobacterales bacterium]|nr:CoA-binding protein [Bryobacterales bacterium]
MQNAQIEQIEAFLKLRRIAMVGVSRDPKDFSRGLFAAFVERGYEVVPVNPNAGIIGDVLCYPRLTSIEDPVEGVLILTPRAQTAQVCEDAIAMGVPRLWMYRAIGHGSVDAEAAEKCRRAGIDVIEGYCPFLFLEDVAWYHRAHGAVLTVLGKYPRREDARLE